MGTSLGDSWVPSPTAQRPCHACDPMAQADLEPVATWMSRAALGVVAASTAVAGVATTTIVRTLWSSDPQAVDAYGTALSLHGTLLSFACSPAAALAVVVPLLLPGRPRAAHSHALAALGMLAWIVAGAIAVAGANAPFDLAAMTSPWPLRAAWCFVVAHAAFALALATALVGQVRALPVATAIGLGGLAVASGLVAGAGGTTLASEAAVFDARMVPGVLYDATRFWGVIVAVVLAVALLTRIDPARVGSPALVFVALAVMPAMVGERLLVRLLAVADLDVHLHDTYVEVAHAHLSMFAAGAAMLAALHVFELRVLGRQARAALAWPGAVLTCGGLLAHHVLLFVLGTRGMPRRYPVYPEIFAELQRLAQIAGGVAALGAVLVAAAWLFGRRGRAESPANG